MDESQVNAFLKLQPQLNSAYDEIGLLSKKKPSDAVNKFKLKFINNMLKRANHLLDKQYIPFPDVFELFDEDDIPNNSDVVFVLSNYLTSLEKMRCDNIQQENMGSYWYWTIDGKESNKRTDPPKIR